MKAISIIILVVVALSVTGFAYASSQQSERSPMGQDEQTFKILCLNHNLSNPNFDVSVSPAYDWVHAGQQGLYVTVTNKTTGDMTVDWTETSHFGELAGSEKPYDVVPPGATFSKTLWPRSDISKAGRFQQRSINISLRTSSGDELRDAILVDVQGAQRICSM